MKLSTRASYGTRALLDLAIHSPGKFDHNSERNRAKTGYLVYPTSNTS